MSAYHFEGSSESGFQVSGILEAENESQARRKAQKFCGTRELVVVFEAGDEPQGIRAEKAGECPNPSPKDRAMSLVASLACALQGVRRSRTAAD